MAVKGNNGNHGKKGHSGRKSKAEELGLERLLHECWTPAERRACIKKLAKDAKSQDFKERHEARKLLLAYAFGRPKETQDQDVFDFNNADLSQLNDYELERLIAGDSPRPVFAAASARIAREKAKAG